MVESRSWSIGASLAGLKHGLLVDWSGTSDIRKLGVKIWTVKTYTLTFKMKLKTPNVYVFEKNFGKLSGQTPASIALSECIRRFL